MLLKWLVRVYLWHSEQALKQENIQTVLRTNIITIKNKNMAMICALWKGSRFLFNIGIIYYYKFFNSLMKSICVLYMFSVCIHMFYIYLL